MTRDMAMRLSSQHVPGPASGGGVGESIDALLERLEREISAVQEDIAALEGRAPGDSSAAERLSELHRHSNALIGKYVISRRLRESTDFSSLMRALREVLESLVGLASFAVYWRESPDDDSLLLCTVEPEDSDSFRDVRIGDGPIGVVAGLDDAWVPGPEERKYTIPPTPIGWFPLRRGKESRGGIAVFEVLSHKKGFEPRDLDLLELISTHAAGAIESARAAARQDPEAVTATDITARAGDGREP